MKCYHCGDDVIGAPIVFDEKNFCCNGCRQVYEILSENGLTNFYEMNEGVGVKPSTEKHQKYATLNVPEVKEQFISFQNENIYIVTFFLPAIHCSSCIYLLENLKKLNPGILKSEANFTARTLELTLTKETQLSTVALLLDRIGYQPELRPKTEAKDTSPYDKKLLLQLGLAGFAFGSVMLWTFPEYLGLDETFEPFRNFSAYLTLLVSIPVLFYSASGYFNSAYTAIRSKQLNLDIPIALGILVLFLKSSSSILMQEGPGYMDSFTGFVFFLLIGKWFQAKTYRNMAFDNDPKSYFPLGVHRITTNNTEEVVLIDKLKEGDRIRIFNEEIIPCDITLTSDEAVINTSFITGESELITLKKGERIYAGSKLIGTSIDATVERTTDRSKFASIWNKPSDSTIKDAHFLTRDESKLTKIFLLLVFSIATIGGITWLFIDPSQVVEIVTAILVVACPCALALSFPFVYGNALRKYGKNGLYFKNSKEIQKLPAIDTFVFDKTGTLTKDRTSGVSFTGTLTQEEIDLAYALTRQSTHPYSKSISNWLSNQVKTGVRITDFEEHPGKGLVGSDEHGHQIKLGNNKLIENAPHDNESGSYLAINNKLIGKFVFKSQLRARVLSMLKKISNTFNIFLLSGDNQQDAKLFGNLDHKLEMHFNQSPTEKSNFIQQLQTSGASVAYIGDGLNDTEALHASTLGISVADDVFRFTPACDAIISGDKVHYLDQFIAFGSYTAKVLKVCMVFSLLYNTIGITFALMGYVTPLFAAILMPLSSITIVFISTGLIQAKKMISSLN